MNQHKDFLSNKTENFIVKSLLGCFSIITVNKQSRISWNYIEISYYGKNQTNLEYGKGTYLISWSQIKVITRQQTNKLLMCKIIIKPMQNYGIELWGCSSKSIIALMQRNQEKVLRSITIIYYKRKYSHRPTITFK